MKGGFTGVSSQKVIHREIWRKNEMITAQPAINSPMGTLFPTGTCQVRPDLKEGTYELIDELHEITEEGHGSISFKELLATFGIPLTPEQEHEVAGRGDVTFDPGDRNFVNKGKKLKLDVQGVSLTVPEEVSGHYESSDDTFKFHFDPGHTLKACQGFFCINTENIDGNRKGINVDMQGTLFDSCILFEPPAHRENH